MQKEDKSVTKNNISDLERRKIKLEKNKKKKFKRFMRKISLISVCFIFVFISIFMFSNAGESINVFSATFDDIENIVTNSSNLPLEGKTIVLDAGHDEFTNEYEGYIEGVAMFSLAQQIKPLLEEKGATVYLTREDGNFVELWERAAITNILSLEKLKEIKLAEGYSTNDEIFNEIDYLISILETFDGAGQDYVSNYLNTPFDEDNNISEVMQRIFTLQEDETLQNSFLFISLHTDGLEQEYYDYVGGADVYYISNEMDNDFGAYYTNYTGVENNIAFADILLDDIDAIGMQRSDILEGNFHVLREVNIPAILVENGYHTNDTDREKLETPQFITDLSFAYESAITEYFNSLK